MPCEHEKDSECNGKCDENPKLTQAIENDIIIKSYKRKMEIFNALDEAFYKVMTDLDDRKENVSFEEMYNAIEILRTKIYRGEIGVITGAYQTTNEPKEQPGHFR